MMSNNSTDEIITHSKKVIEKKLWSTREDNQLKDLVQFYGTNNWPTIAKYVINRSSKQCRERWKAKFNPNLIKGNWKNEEDELILQLYDTYGSRWKLIAQSVIGRSEHDIRNRFFTLDRFRTLNNSSAGVMLGSDSNSENLDTNSFLLNDCSTDNTISSFLRFNSNQMQQSSWMERALSSTHASNSTGSISSITNAVTDSTSHVDPHSFGNDKNHNNNIANNDSYNNTADSNQAMTMVNDINTYKAITKNFFQQNHPNHEIFIKTSYVTNPDEDSSINEGTSQKMYYHHSVSTDSSDVAYTESSSCSTNSNTNSSNSSSSNSNNNNNNRSSNSCSSSSSSNNNNNNMNIHFPVDCNSPLCMSNDCSVITPTRKPTKSINSTSTTTTVATTTTTTATTTATNTLNNQLYLQNDSLIMQRHEQQLFDLHNPSAYIFQDWNPGVVNVKDNMDFHVLPNFVSSFVLTVSR